MTKTEPIILMPKTILVEMKRCSKCGDYLELKDYDGDRKAANGLKAHCKYCRNKYMKEYKRKKRLELSV